MTLTFLDAGVLIAAYHGLPSEAEPALALLRDKTRAFVSSPFLWLETMPKALYYRNTSEIAFYNHYFETKVKISIDDVVAITRVAREEGRRCGLGAMDALHVAAAHLAEADELITTEKPGRAIHKASLVRVVYLAPAG